MHTRNAAQQTSMRKAIRSSGNDFRSGGRKSIAVKTSRNIKVGAAIQVCRSLTGNATSADAELYKQRASEAGAARIALTRRSPEALRESSSTEFGDQATGSSF